MWKASTQRLLYNLRCKKDPILRLLLLVLIFHCILIATFFLAKVIRILFKTVVFDDSNTLFAWGISTYSYS